MVGIVELCTKTNYASLRNIIKYSLIPLKFNFLYFFRST